MSRPFTAREDAICPWCGQRIPAGTRAVNIDGVLVHHRQCPDSSSEADA